MSLGSRSGVNWMRLKWQPMTARRSPWPAPSCRRPAHLRSARVRRRAARPGSSSPRAACRRSRARRCRPRARRRPSLPASRGMPPVATLSVHAARQPLRGSIPAARGVKRSLWWVYASARRPVSDGHDRRHGALCYFAAAGIRWTRAWARDRVSADPGTRARSRCKPADSCHAVNVKLPGSSPARTPAYSEPVPR